MSDLIDRKAALNKITAIDTSIIPYARAMEYVDELKNYVIKIIETLPSVEPERKTFHVIDKKTGQEADPFEIALNEEWAKHLCYCDMEGFAILEDGTLILADECGWFEFIQENDRFEIVWDEMSDE